ncbi:MAG: bifunctional adenosylcobinamide kinase/adenosylcobinamide-phosphate guanylyltransferase [Nitrospiraceae bacterium]|nr:bifunctional adenosylcobinamide kinase/adenosylcobinamide-phosphate guanylyltransferase [Nitrospiraceae bacterium]
MSSKIVFITGGARSGKSGFALNTASALPGRKGFIATATAVDEEMRERIARHRADRGAAWDTIEEPLQLAKAIEEAAGAFDVLVVDCLTVWLSNVMWSGLDVMKEVETLVRACEKIRDRRRISLYSVSNEVGTGIVPANEIARKFRDIAGILNQKIAAVSDEVYLVTAGIPIQIKGKGES